MLKKLSALELEEMLSVLLLLSEKAGDILMTYYKQSSLCVEYKSKDDPVTEADKAANAFLEFEIAKAFPHVALVSEEGHQVSGEEEKRKSGLCFYVDPLDGTREFIAQNGEFSVMIGLACNGIPCLGVVHVPDSGKTFAAASGLGAFEYSKGFKNKKPLQTRQSQNLTGARIALSRRSDNEITRQVLRQIGISELLFRGSAGLKAVMVASGEADLLVYPSFAGQLWDTCAPTALLLEAGGFASNMQGEVIDYETNPLKHENGFLASASRSLSHEFLRVYRAF